MSFFTEGNAIQIFSAFGLRDFILASGTKQEQIYKDIPRTFFLGTRAQREQHVGIWSDLSQSPPDHYAQGNMTAGNLQLLFGYISIDPFFSQEELDTLSSVELRSKTAETSFAYVDQDGKTRGLTLLYRKDDPSKWIIGLSEDANRPPNETKIRILTSLDLRPLCKEAGQINIAPSEKEGFISAIKSSKLAGFINQIIDQDGNINPAAAVINFFLQVVAASKDNFINNDHLLEAFGPELLENKALTLLAGFGLDPSFHQLEQCLDQDSELFKLITQCQLTGNKNTDKKQLAIILFLDRYELNKRQDVVRRDEVLVDFISTLLFSRDSNIERRLISCLANEAAPQYFSDILPRYKEAAAWRQEPLTVNLLSTLVEIYAESPGDKYLPGLSFCSYSGQISASYVLLEQGMYFDLVKGYVKNRALVYSINQLKSFNLEHVIPNLLEKDNNIAALEKIFSLDDYKEKQACLVLFAQGQLNPPQYFKLVESFKTYPQLAQLILNAHENKFTAEELKTLAFNETMHRAANVLTHYDVAFRFENLTPIVCQTILAIGDLCKDEGKKRKTRDYLSTALPAVLEFYKGETSMEKAKEVVQFKDMPVEPIAEGDQPSEEAQQKIKESPFIKDLGDFLLGQMTVFLAAKQQDIPEADQLMQSRDIANALVYALGLFGEKVSVELSGHVFKGFSQLPADAKIDEEIVNTAFEALHACKIPLVPFDRLLQERQLAKAIVGAAAHQLPVRQLLDLDNPLNPEIIAALNNLNEVEPKNKKAYELAIQQDNKGHDFRRLLALIPVAGISEKAKCSLLENLQSGIVDGRVEILPTIASIPEPQTQMAAYDLDESLVFNNRLRALGFDNQVIEFMAKDDDKSRYFYKAVRKIEAESDATKARLIGDEEHPEKYNQFIVDERKYRQDLYQAMYDALKPDVPNVGQRKSPEEKIQLLGERLKEAEQLIMANLQKDRSVWARWVMKAITNFATIVMTITSGGLLGLLHYYHYKKTGDYLFFASTRSEESYKTLGRETLDEAKEEIMKENVPPLPKA